MEQLRKNKGIRIFGSVALIFKKKQIASKSIMLKQEIKIVDKNFGRDYLAEEVALS